MSITCLVVMKRIGLLLAFIIAILLAIEVKGEEKKEGYIYSDYSSDSTMVYDYYRSRYCEQPFVQVHRVNTHVFSDRQFSEKPWWFYFEPNIMRSHWDTYGKEVDAILDNLGIGERTLRARLVFSLRTGRLEKMLLLVEEEIVPLLNLLPLEKIFSIYESVDSSQFITIYDHKPCEEDNKYFILNVLCR